MAHVADAQLDQVAGAQLTVNPQIEQGKLAQPALHLEPDTDCPDLLKLERCLLADELPLVPSLPRYLVEGVVRASGERTAVRAWLMEASTGTEVWSDNLELNDASDTNERQSFITRLTNQVREAMITAERRRFLTCPSQR